MTKSPEDQWVPEPTTLVPTGSCPPVPSGHRSQINGSALQSFTADRGERRAQAEKEVGSRIWSTDSGGLCDPAGPQAAVERRGLWPVCSESGGLAETDRDSRKERGNGAGRSRPFLAREQQVQGCSSDVSLARPPFHQGKR